MATLRIGRLVTAFVGAFIVIGAAAAVVLWFALSRDPVPIHVRWKPGTSDAARIDAERRFSLIQGEVTEGTTWAYRLADMSTDNIRALVEDPSVDDTANINRIRFRPAFAIDRQRRLIFFSLLVAGLGAIAVVIARFRRLST